VWFRQQVIRAVQDELKAASKASGATPR
jgi:hypothetical protein